jgi:hypothetical protein
MPNNPSQITQAYLTATRALEDIIQSPDATDEQIAAASGALDDLTVMLGTFSVEDVKGRTALLNSLIVELQKVTAEIEPNPVGKVLDDLNGVLKTANTLQDAQKKQLANLGTGKKT